MCGFNAPQFVEIDKSQVQPQYGDKHSIGCCGFCYVWHICIVKWCKVIGLKIIVIYSVLLHFRLACATFFRNKILNLKKWEVIESGNWCTLSHQACVRIEVICRTGAQHWRPQIDCLHNSKMFITFLFISKRAAHKHTFVRRFFVVPRFFMFFIQNIFIKNKRISLVTVSHTRNYS